MFRARLKIKLWQKIKKFKIIRFFCLFKNFITASKDFALWRGADFQNVTKFTWACFETNNFTCRKLWKTPLKYMLPVHFSKAKLFSSPLPHSLLMSIAHDAFDIWKSERGMTNCWILQSCGRSSHCLYTQQLVSPFLLGCVSGRCAIILKWWI